MGLRLSPRQLGAIKIDYGDEVKKRPEDSKRVTRWAADKRAKKGTTKEEEEERSEPAGFLRRDSGGRRLWKKEEKERERHGERGGKRLDEGVQMGRWTLIYIYSGPIT